MLSPYASYPVLPLSIPPHTCTARTHRNTVINPLNNHQSIPLIVTTIWNDKSVARRSWIFKRVYGTWSMQLWILNISHSKLVQRSICFFFFHLFRFDYGNRAIQNQLEWPISSIYFCSIFFFLPFFSCIEWFLLLYIHSILHDIQH